MHIITNYDNVFQKYVCIVDAAHSGVKLFDMY